MKPKTKIVSFRLPESLVVKLRKEADRRDMGFSQLLKAVFMQGFKKKGKKKT